MREIPDDALDGVDGVINLAGLSNDPTAEFDPEANWQMNARRHRDARARRASSAASSASSSPRRARSTTACRPACTTRPPPIEPRGAYATSKRYGEEALLELVDEGLVPGDPAQRHGLRLVSPRMRFDLVVNTFVKDALLNGRLMLHGGGWMWRPLVDVRDVADAMIAAYEAPAEKVRGEIFNVLHSNYQIRELAMLVAGLGAAAGRSVELEEVPAPEADARLRVLEREARRRRSASSRAARCSRR